MYQSSPIKCCIHVHLCVLSCCNMCHSMHERIKCYIDGAGEVYTMHESLMVILQEVLRVRGFGG